MVESKRNESSGAAVDGRSPADLLREQISAAQQNSALRMMAPALPKVLGMLDAYIVHTDARLDFLARQVRILQDRGP